MKIVLSQSQLRQTEEIPELISLLRAYKALDNLLTKYKHNAGILYDIEDVKRLLEEVHELTAEFRRLKTDILHFKTPDAISTVYSNPELNAMYIDEYLSAYRNAKRTLDYSELADIQRKLAIHIKKLTDLLIHYRQGKYYIPKMTKKLIEKFL